MEKQRALLHHLQLPGRYLAGTVVLLSCPHAHVITPEPVTVAPNASVFSVFASSEIPLDAAVLTIASSILPCVASTFVQETPRTFPAGPVLNTAVEALVGGMGRGGAGEEGDRDATEHGGEAEIHDPR